jgi:hypothetical protein
MAEMISDDHKAALAAAKRLARSIDAVRGIDFGWVYTKGKRTQRLGVRFHMDRKRKPSELAISQRLPATLEGVEVDVLAVGYAPHDSGPRAPQKVLDPGISIGSRKQQTTGTLGPIVRDLVSGDTCLMSNWHVFCGGPEAVVGDEITQPGPMDYSNGATVALLSRWLRLDQQFDAAIARVVAGTSVAAELFGTTLRVTATKPPEVGMKLVKSGAVSGVTNAIVDGVSGSYRLNYAQYGYQLQWMSGFRLVPDPAASQTISLPGDSGSLWVDAGDGKAVGLHFAGEDDASPLNDYALAHPIEEVFAQLNVELTDGLEREVS